MAGETPDRNLAMDIVRVTEAAALAASRWVGAGDKEGADGAAVDAMRLVLGSVQMDGIVVIGEGEKDEAPMLFNGEAIGDGSPPADGHRRRSGRRHHAHRQGPRQRPRGHRAERAGHDVQPRPVRLHGEDRRRTRVQGRHRHHQVGGREHRGGGQGQGRDRSATSRSSSSSAIATTTSSPRCAPPRPASGSSPMATWPVPSRRHGPTPAPTSCSASAARPKASSRPPR